MESKKMVNVMMMMMFYILIMVIGMVVGQGGAATTPNPFPFSGCYGRCLFFCMIEPQNLCTCTSTCLKKCLDTPAKAMATEAVVDEHGENLSFCKLGCVTSLCSNMSKPQNFDGESMEGCVDSCSNKCTMSYQLVP